MKAWTAGMLVLVAALTFGAALVLIGQAALEMDRQ